MITGMMIKDGSAAPWWRFERAQGKHFVSAGGLRCSEQEAEERVRRLAEEHGAAKASNGTVTIASGAAGRSRKVSLG